MNWQNKRVLVTGHTGFKGGWICLWLNKLGAEIYGLALDPPTNPNFYTAANVRSVLKVDERIDIRDQKKVNAFFQIHQPEIVFHLAAQPLVQYSYDAPIETYATNVMGTAHILEAARFTPSLQAVVIVTTDKCYENSEKEYSYLETDRLGGLDPYSSSKACTELLVSAYRASYFSRSEPIRLATARAGNVIGGGDFAINRLIPDCVRAFIEKKPITLRYPHAIRPWQHVLESIHGYLSLAEKLVDESGHQYAEAWNFGPALDDMKPVEEIANKICDYLNINIALSFATHRHESSILRLDSRKANERLGWRSKWTISKAIEETVSWYQHWITHQNMFEFSQLQIERYRHA